MTTIARASFVNTVALSLQANSKTVIANAWQHRSDAAVSAAVFCGVAGAMAGYPMLDPMAGLLVSGVIVKAFSLSEASRALRRPARASGYSTTAWLLLSFQRGGARCRVFVLQLLGHVTSYHAVSCGHAALLLACTVPGASAGGHRDIYRRT